MTITVSETARTVLAEISKKTQGHIRLSVHSKGCAGMIYEFTFPDTINLKDEEVDFNGFSLFLDCDRIMYIVGTHIDHVNDLEGRRFIFSNKAFNTCGCGHSFRVGGSE